MNPSADGWIKKLLKEVSKNETFLQLPKLDFYLKLKKSGYIYGNNIMVIDNCIEQSDFSEEELCKVNHVLALYYIHQYKSSKKDFVESLIQFYKGIEEYKSSFITGLLGKKKSAALLEHIIYKRIHIDDNVLTKNFHYFISNALLFIDVLAYRKFLITNSISKSYFKNIEATLETVALNVFEAKINKTKYDQTLIRLFESSLRHSFDGAKSYPEVIKNLKKPLEKYYCVDIACMASWTDAIIDQKESEFLKKLGHDLHLKPEHIKSAIKDIHEFYGTNKNYISLLANKNKVQSFYDNSSKMVTKLISRNSKRLIKELRESKELMVLLTKSTTRNLTKDEQKKVQDQLMDIIKSIPSLAIFLLPGGAILLPLFIKFIPKLLPSAFDENRIEE